MATSMAGAQTATYTNTYDTSSSITTIGAGVYDGSSENWRFDYGGGVSTGSHSKPAWSSAQDATGNSGGSVKLSWADSEPAGGSSSAAFTTDLFAYPGNNVTAISFDLYVDPSSTEGRLRRLWILPVVQSQPKLRWIQYTHRRGTECNSWRVDTHERLVFAGSSPRAHVARFQ